MGVSKTDFVRGLQCPKMLWLDSHRPEEKIIPEEVPIERHEPLKTELASFADCVVNKKSPKVDAKLGLSALEVALEITRQIRAQMAEENAV